jgi:hypothetical protein
MFSGRIGATARAEGVNARILRDPKVLANADAAIARLIVDLDLVGALDAAVAWKARTGGEVVGFVAHTNTEAIRAAKEAGFDRVLTRGRFVEVLPELLRGT